MATGATMIQEWEHSAKILIYHFVVIKGMIPFGLYPDDKHKKDIEECAKLDPEASIYMRKLTETLIQRGESRRR